MEEVRQQLLLDMGFSQKAVNILEQELNMYSMENPTISAKHKGTCGDILFLSLKIENEKITNAAYEYIGCAGLQSCASALTEMIKGKSVNTALKFEIDDIINYLEGIPRQKYECAEIARDCLHKTIQNWKNPGLKVV